MSANTTLRFLVTPWLLRTFLGTALAAALAAAGAAQSPQRAVAAPPLCAEVARLANEGALEAEMRSGGTLFAQFGELKFDTVRFEDGGTGSARINENGIVILDGDEREHEPTPDPAVDWSSDDFRWADPLGTLRRDGETYIVWGQIQGEGLRYVSRVTAQRVHQVLCQFAQRAAPKRALVSGDGPVCDAALAGTLDYAPFEEAHAVADLGERETSPGPKAAQVDVDNDGTPEHLIATLYYSGAGQGCDIEGLAVLDESRTAIALTGTGKLVRGTADTCGDIVRPFTFKGRSYLARQRDRGRGNTTIFDLGRNRGVRSNICEISNAPVNVVLTRGEQVLRAAEQQYMNPWEYAFLDSGFGKAELLLDSGRSVDDTIHDQSLLGWAVWQERRDVFDWLLEHGAKPDFNGTYPLGAPLRLAVEYGHLDMATRLVEAGANPMPGLLALPRDLSKNTAAVAPFIRAATAKSGFLPELILRHAVYSRAPLLDDFLAAGVPVELMQAEWHAGARLSVPFEVAGDLAANPADLAKVARLYGRTRLSPELGAGVFYGTYLRGWEVYRAHRSTVTDEQLLLFSTAFCTYFLEVDCGPAELVARARAWAGALRLPCDARVGGGIDAVACSVVMYYVAIATAGYGANTLISPVSVDSPRTGSPVLTVVNLRDLYLAKHARD